MLRIGGSAGTCNLKASASLSLMGAVRCPHCPGQTAVNE